MASETHQMAISMATARVRVTAGFPGSRSVKRRIEKKAINPRISPIYFLVIACNRNTKIPENK
jgi:hypothetical protein